MWVVHGLNPNGQLHPDTEEVRIQTSTRRGIKKAIQPKTGMRASGKGNDHKDQVVCRIDEAFRR